MRFVKALLVSNWQSLLKYAALFAFLGFVLYWQLGSLVPGYSAGEQVTYGQAGFSQLMDNPLNAPYLLGVKLLSFIQPDSLLATRLMAATTGMAVLGLFCGLLYHWHGSRVAIMGTLLFGTSAWFLHVARMGTPDVALFGIVALIACGFWLKESRSAAALLVCFALAALLLYVPGMLWFIGAGIIWQWKTIDYIFRQKLGSVFIGMLLLVILLGPLIWGLVKDASLLMTWLGMPKEWPAPVDVLINIVKVPYHLIVSNTPDPVRWLGTAPILDVFSVAMFVVGGYLYIRKFRLLRTPLFISLLVMGLILTGLNGQASLSFIIPVIYLIAATGVGYLLDQWLRVFPRNPIARGIGYACISIVLVLACAYQLRHYFVGWPAARATAEAYTVQKP